MIKFSEGTLAKISDALYAMDQEVTEALAEEFCGKRVNYVGDNSNFVEPSENGEFEIDAIEHFDRSFETVSVTIVNDECVTGKSATLLTHGNVYA